MDTKLSINIAIMFALSFALTYATAFLITPADADAPLPMSFIAGRSFGSTIFPLLIALIPSGIYKLIKKKTMPGYIILSWVLWALLNIMALFGSMLAAQGIV
jgi:hypothetical protein